MEKQDMGATDTTTQIPPCQKEVRGPGRVFKNAPFEVIEELGSAMQCLVHVEGWNPACVFVYLGTMGGNHILRTPKTKKDYLVSSSTRLLWTRNNRKIWVFK